MDNIKIISEEIDCHINANNAILVADPEECSDLFSSHQRHMTIVHQNIRSINRNFDDMMVLLERLKTDMDIIFLTECWLSKVTSLPIIDNYNSFSTAKTLNQNDGVVLYARSGDPCKIIEPMLEDASGLIYTKSQEYAILCVYRPPSFLNTDRFIDSLDKILTDIKSYRNIVLIGDINIDIGPNNTDPNSDNYLFLLASHGLEPTHMHPTHFKTCLDHIFAKTLLPTQTIICDTSVTDHSTTMFSILNQDNPKSKLHRYKRIDYSSAVHDLCKVDWRQILCNKTAEDATNIFLNMITYTIGQHTSIKYMTRRKRVIKPWITPGLVRCIRHRDRLNQKQKRDKNNEVLQVTYKRYRNTCNKLLKYLKGDYYRSKIRKHTNNIKKQWEIIKEINYCNQKVNKSAELLKIKSNCSESLSEINRYFANVGSSLARSILQRTNQNEKQLSKKINALPSTPNTFVLLPVDETEVLNLIRSLKNTNSCGWDGIPTSFFKLAGPIITTPITIICNLCFTSGIFPEVLKKSIVIPLHKSGDSDVISNFRPITLLPTLSKILEKAINKRIKFFLEKFNLLSKTQFGFRQNRATEDALKHLISNISTDTDKNLKCLSIFMDLAKAFDTVSVPLLLQKLERKGIRGVPLKLISHYLSNRKQIVKIDEHVSSEEPIEYGVPQGSILGPTLFLIYIDDLPQLNIEDARIVTFADDTVITFVGPDWREVNEKAEEGFKNVTRWLEENLLTLNSLKTKIMTFYINKKSKPLPENIRIKAHTCNFITNCDCNYLATTPSIKYLGIEIDEQLNWKTHIFSLTNRVRKLIFIFRNLRYICDSNLLIKIYYALCQSIITYGITVWGGCAKSTLIKLERAQRYVLKTMTFKNYRFPTHELYSTTLVLNVRQLFIEKIISMQHKKPQDYPKSRRRNDIVYKKPACRTKFFQRFFTFLAPFLYNKINKTTGIRDLQTYSMRKSTKHYLRSLNYNQTEELLDILT